MVDNQEGRAEKTLVAAGVDNCSHRKSAGMQDPEQRRLAQDIGTAPVGHPDGSDAYHQRRPVISVKHIKPVGPAGMTAQIPHIADTG